MHAPQVSRPDRGSARVHSVMYGKGISREGSLLDVGVDLGIVKKSGAWFTYEGEQLGQGRENAKTFLAENLEIMVEITEKMRVEAGIGRRRDAAGVHAGRRSRSRSTLQPGSARRGRRPPIACRAVTRRYFVRTFGCQMNEHDSERIAGLLEADGHGAGRRPSTTPTSSCSTRAASGRTPTTSSTATSAT